MATYQEQLALSQKRRELKEELTMATLRGDEERIRDIKLELRFGEAKANGFYEANPDNKPVGLGELLWSKILQKRRA